MPPFSKELWEEGAQVRSFKLVNKGQFDEAGVIKILSEEPAQYPGCSGTRTLSDVGPEDVNVNLTDRTFPTSTLKSPLAIEAPCSSERSSRNNRWKSSTFTCTRS